MVTSNPVNIYTDNDRLSDYEEFKLKLDPRNSDTDNDGLLDDIDPFPLLIDGDNDGLSDYKEIILGTSVNTSDTDGDGLKDGHEVIGWDFITNPLSSDSDHDFLADNTEMMTTQFRIDNRIELDQPISLLFNGKCEKATSAQIAITLSYGGMTVEDNELSSAPDLNITLIKDDANIIIFNGTTNSTCVFSKVIDFKDIIESKGLTYHGDYVLLINNTDAGYYLEQFEIEVAKYLNPNLNDFDEDGIMDGVETGLLVRGKDCIDYKELYGDTTIHYPITEIGWWALDDGIGYSAKDYSPYENEGILNNMEFWQWAVPGKVGTSCLRFTGNDDFIDCGNATLFNFERNSTFSLAFWLKTTSINQAILSKIDIGNDNRGYNIFLDEQGILNTRLVNSWDDNLIWVKGYTEINNDDWHFITVSYDGSSNASGIKIYVDGNLDHSVILSNNLNRTIENKVNFTIGTSFRNDFYQGYFDDIRVFDFDLSEHDILWLNNSYTLQVTRSLNQDSEPNITNQFSLEIPHLGRVYNANITLAIYPNEKSIGNGSINIQLNKEDLNNTLADVVLLEKDLEYNNTDSFDFLKFVDIKIYLANSLIREYYGKYTLNIRINGTDSVDKFILDEFYIETDTYIEAGPTDIIAWITDPAKNDTDNDGWLDTYEIFETKTNPLSDDTDGDGAIDPYDRDPLRDLMVEISPIYGIRNLWFFVERLYLEIVVTFKLRGKKFYFCTPSILSERKEDASNFEGNYADFEGLYYYANIDDDILAQPDIINLNLQLWDMGGALWDTRIINTEVDYIIGEESTFTAYSEGFLGDKNEMQIMIRTNAIEKANTIAIYQNGTTFNGHYQTQEKMNIFQLYINQPGSVGPFVSGPNIIVIPTSLFTETILNAKIQKGEDTVLYKEGCSKFISINRTGDMGEGCGDIDFVFIRYNISFADALIVLYLLRTCIINETTGETALTYCYTKKEDGFNPVLMNLPSAVLGYIPWLCYYENSAQGRTPRGFLKWIGDKISKVVNFVVGVFVAIAESFITIMKAIIEFISNILMALIPFLADLVMLLVRIAILIIVYIAFAISLILIGGIVLIFIPF
ncbi:MAG: LamG-like jellyroll fold domain-containing protein, partial [Candidatus Hermodarchaeota archaeon]